jgi:hypothetical protein
LSEAATAAAAFAAAAEVILFRRVTRWFALTAPREMEWEWCRELVCLTGGPVWVNGRDRGDSCTQGVGFSKRLAGRDRERKNWQLTLKDVMITSRLFAASLPFFFSKTRLRVGLRKMSPASLNQIRERGGRNEAIGNVAEAWEIAHWAGKERGRGKMRK